MYLPRHFQMTDDDAARDVLRSRVAGTLVVATDDDLEASLLPWVLDATVLRGHVARANPLARVLGEAHRCLVIFDTVDGYVSPSWYPSKDEHHEVVPTWNYEAVHVHGTARLVDDEAWIRELVTALTERQESSMPAPWAVSDAPEEYIAKMLRAIVGVEVTIERIEAKAKLSQNRSDADVDGVIAGLVDRPVGSSLRDRMTVSRDERLRQD